MNNGHLGTHGMTPVAYLAKYPDAELYSPESKAACASGQLKHYADDQDLRRRVSAGTKVGMRRPESWQKFEQFVTRRSEDWKQNGNPLTGHKHPAEFGRRISENKERAAKISVGKKKWWDDGRVGKTVEELYGEETGKQFRETKSAQTSGELNPAYGKVYANAGGRGKMGRYKSKLFRSLYEYSYLKHLELSGIDLAVVMCEPFCIAYKLDGRSRTYHPDFLYGTTLVEVKPVRDLDKEINLVKFMAAEAYCAQNGLRFVVATEQDFKIIRQSLAYVDPDVEWIRR